MFWWILYHRLKNRVDVHGIFKDIALLYDEVHKQLFSTCVTLTGWYRMLNIHGLRNGCTGSHIPKQLGDCEQIEKNGNF